MSRDEAVDAAQSQLVLLGARQSLHDQLRVRERRLGVYLLLAGERDGVSADQTAEKVTCSASPMAIGNCIFTHAGPCVSTCVRARARVPV